MKSAKPILFCDFDGVLSHDKYWRSLLPEKYQEVQEFLFGNDKSIVNAWMRGRHTAEEVNQLVSEHIGIPFESLWGLFVQDCQTIRVSQEVLKRLSDLRDRYTVILITGNMDSFNRFTRSALRLDDYFDLISNSFDEGMTKTDEGGVLFLKYANKYEISLENCLIFDDSQNVCKTFSDLGGKSCLVTREKNLEQHLEELMSQDLLVSRSDNIQNIVVLWTSRIFKI